MPFLPLAGVCRRREPRVHERVREIFKAAARASEAASYLKHCPLQLLRHDDPPLRDEAAKLPTTPTETEAEVRGRIGIRIIIGVSIAPIGVTIAAVGVTIATAIIAPSVIAPAIIAAAVATVIIAATAILDIGYLI